MTTDRFREILELVGMTQVGAARFFDVDERTARRWAAGEIEIPRSIAMLLELMAARKVKAAYLLALIGEADDRLHDQRKK
jgi:transcriptional regulator with XRE-family HTH domain